MCKQQLPYVPTDHMKYSSNETDIFGPKSYTLDVKSIIAFVHGGNIRMHHEFRLLNSTG